MVIISDTTPLISLLKIGRLNLLEQLFGGVHIPPAVFFLLCCGGFDRRLLSLSKRSTTVSAHRTRTPNRKRRPSSAPWRFSA